MSVTDIPLPQNTSLYEASNNQIVEPRLSLTEIVGSGNNNSYSNFYSKQYILNLYSQNVNEINLILNDKNISCTRGPNYFNLNGFDFGFDLRFLNQQSPTICFAPLIQAKDLDKNVPLASTALPNTYTISNYTSYLSNNLNVNDLILLRNQTTNAQNKIYRVVAINASSLTVYDDTSDTYFSTGLPSINVILSQNQNYIFTRVKVEDSLGVFYYGLYNTGGLYWVSQTAGLQLNTADYGISFNTELSSDTIAYNVFSNASITPQLNEVIAINVLTNGSGSTGGKTSGLYLITKITNALVYFQPIYPSYVFIQQFVKIKYDLDLLQENQVWYVNPETVGANNYLYATVFFNFNKLALSSTVINSPINWALQTGGANDEVLGFSLFMNDVNNNYIKNSDSFSIAVSPPTWSEGEIEGLNLKINYSTNTLTISEEAVVN